MHPPPDPEQTGDDVITICQEFARKGFVAFDVEYRRGNYMDDDYVTAQSLLALYRARQDGRGAIKCIIQRQQYQNTNGQTDDYKIDVNNIFIGGNSAGSIIAMTAAYYYRQTKIDSITPGVAAVLSSTINPDYYEPDVNAAYAYNPTQDYRPYIKGILNDWGTGVYS